MKDTKKTSPNLSSFVTAFKAGLHAEHCRNTRHLLGGMEEGSFGNTVLEERNGFIKKSCKHCPLPCQQLLSLFAVVEGNIHHTKASVSCKNNVL